MEDKYENDDAAELLLPISHSGLVPVWIVADCYCLFRAAITACAANVVGQCDTSYDLL